MDVGSLKKLHCIGIGGIGVSAIARFFVSRGISVSGSDVQESDEVGMLRKKGIKIGVPHAQENIPADVDMVVFSPAVPKDNVEMVAALERGIPLYAYPQALGLLTEHFTGVAVSGTNGKTTTTALLGLMLECGGKDPTVIVGGRVPGWDNNLRTGAGDILVVEGCEYRRAMLELSPHVIVLTNIEEDHLDYYKDIDDIVDAFDAYVAKLTEDDLLVYNADDERVCEVSHSTVARVVSFGLSENASVRAKDIVVEEGKQQFTLVVYGNELGTITAHVPGTFNIYNILGATAAALDMGAGFEAVQRAVDGFYGTWRRFERVGTCGTAVVISDYAHHPSAIVGTLKAAREFFPGKKILAVFQPHHMNRTVKLFDQFVESFADADEAIVAEIYHVRGREEEKEKVSSKDLVREMRERGGIDAVSYAKDLEATEKSARSKAKDFDVVVIMGAGDIDRVARDLVS